MIKTLKVLSMVAVAAVAMASRAQASDTLKVNVPFDFVLGGRPLPSGDYQFVMSDYTGVVQIYSTARGRVATAAYMPASTAMPVPGLLFHKHGEQHFLKTISIGRTTIALPTSQAERLAEAAQGAGRAVAATTR